ncbi:MAG: type sorting protein [Flaviaesturariibacter sp.]|nr:type sorting protein [Flaviaesturariibacter sp.]
MKRLLRLVILAVFVPSLSFAQCPTGYSTAALNWDALDFLTTNGTYASYVTASMAATQKFAFGTQTVTITHNFTGTNNVGENTTNTGETSSFGAGADIQFAGNGTFTVTFPTAVQNVKFSIYDIDRSQRASITASNGIIPATINLATLGTSILTISNNNLTNPRVDAANTGVANTANTGTVNVLIAGPITTFTVTTSNTGSDVNFWISDIAACTNASAFPTNYYAVSQPFTGMPGYVMVSGNSSMYQVNPATGAAKLLFTDPSGNNINSTAFDPVNRIIYYTYSLTGSPSTDKAVKKYSFSTKTISTAIADVTTLGIPLYESGVESGAAAFYNGSLYLGVEGYNTAGGNATDRKSIVWRIDFDASLNATGAVQAYGTDADNGSNLLHDWSDIGINNGILYDFDGASGDNDVYQFNMQTGVLSQYTPTFRPSQVAVDWNGNVYNIDSTITPYNGTTGITMAQRFSVVASPALTPGTSYGDGGEAFRPEADFGDAPATYDPVALSPALHETTPTTLRLGNTVNDEYTKKTTALADGDTDDGMPFVAIVNSSGNYLANVNVFNNTGASATVCAWVDFNKDGVFTAGEGTTTLVPSSASIQNVDLFWANPVNNLSPNTYTFIRIRVTSTSNGMTTSNPTGYFPNGEVEDYRVLVNSAVLPVDLVTFEAHKSHESKALLQWTIADERAGTLYDVEKSADGRTWVTIGHKNALGVSNRVFYDVEDPQPFIGTNLYRLRITKSSRLVVYSPIRTLVFDGNVQLKIAPNPVRANTAVMVEALIKGSATIRILDLSGRTLCNQTVSLSAGSNRIPLPLAGSLPAGVYQADVWVGSQRFTQRLTVSR